MNKLLKSITNTESTLHIISMILLIMLIVAFSLSMVNATKLNSYLEEQQEINSYLTTRLELTSSYILALEEDIIEQEAILSAFKEYYENDKKKQKIWNENFITVEDLSLEVERQLQLHLEE